MPERARDVAEAIRVVRTPLQRVGVEHRLDDVAADEPCLDLVLLGLVRHLGLVHAPLAQHLAADAAPVLQCVDEVGAVHVRRQGVPPLGAGAVGVHRQPLVQPARAVLIKHSLDGVLVVALDSDERVEVRAAELVPFDEERIVNRLGPRSRVDVERVHTLELEFALALDDRLERTVRRLLPLELRDHPHHRTFDERRLERHHVVDELVQCVQPAALDEDVLELLLGPLRVDASGLLDLVLQRLFGIQQLLTDVRHRHRQPHHLCLSGLGVHRLHDGVDLGRRQLRHRRGLDGEGLFGARTQHHVDDQRPGLSRLGGEQHHVDLGAALLADAAQRVRVVLPPTRTHCRQHLLLDWLLGFLGQ